MCHRVEDYVDPGLVYWERKEKEEKKAGEEKPPDLSMPGTSSDMVVSEEKRKNSENICRMKIINCYLILSHYLYINFTPHK